MIRARVEALVLARAHAAPGASESALLAPLMRFAPPSLTPRAWLDGLFACARGAREADLLDERRRLTSAGNAALVERLGALPPPRWKPIADRGLPGLGLGIAIDDTAAHRRLDGRDAWCAAIVARAAGIWTAGPPPSLAATCDALAWRALGLAGPPKRCPPEIRALFVERALGIVAGGPPERRVRTIAAVTVGAPRPVLGAIRAALVVRWLFGAFADEVRAAAATVRTGTSGAFGDRKVFISAAWRALAPPYDLDEFKQRLVAEHRAGRLELARADLVAAMDPDLVAASETDAGGATFHFIVRGAT